MAIINDVIAALQEPLKDKGFELVDVEFAKKHGQDNLTVYVYKKEGITLDDCETAHYIVSPILDELNPTQDKPYNLNVSSPGLDRPLKSARDYERNYGVEVDVKLYAPLKGKKLYTGKLISHTDSVTEIDINNDIIKIENTRIAAVFPAVKFE